MRTFKSIVFAVLCLSMNSVGAKDEQDVGGDRADAGRVRPVRTSQSSPNSDAYNRRLAHSVIAHAGVNVTYAQQQQFADAFVAALDRLMRTMAQ